MMMVVVMMMVMTTMIDGDEDDGDNNDDGDEDDHEPILGIFMCWAPCYYLYILYLNLQSNPIRYYHCHCYFTNEKT